MKFFRSALGWFEGKKTILGGAVILAAAVAGVWYGKLDPVTGLALAGAGFSVIGYGNKANRHQAQILTALEGVAQAGIDLRTGRPAAALQVAEATAGDLAPVLAAQAISAAGVTLHLSAPTAAELSDLAGKLLQPIGLDRLGNRAANSAPTPNHGSANSSNSANSAGIGSNLPATLATYIEGGAK